MDFLEKYIQDNRTAFDIAEIPTNTWSKVEDALCTIEKQGLENFVKESRSSFDTAMPPPNLWERIEKELPAAKESVQKKEKEAKIVNFKPRAWMRAAAAVLILALGVGIGLGIGERNSRELASKDAVLSTEQTEALGVFEREVNVKLVAASDAVNSSPEIKADLDRLDTAMEELKAELVDVPPGNREQVVHAMLENYKAKVHVLERILTHIELQNKGFNKNLNDERTEI